KQMPADGLTSSVCSRAAVAQRPAGAWSGERRLPKQNARTEQAVRPLSRGAYLPTFPSGYLDIWRENLSRGVPSHPGRHIDVWLKTTAWTRVFGRSSASL